MVVGKLSAGKCALSNKELVAVRVHPSWHQPDTGQMLSLLYGSLTLQVEQGPQSHLIGNYSKGGAAS
jgi:hypothetical protein